MEQEQDRYTLTDVTTIESHVSAYAKDWLIKEAGREKTLDIYKILQSYYKLSEPEQTVFKNLIAKNGDD